MDADTAFMVGCFAGFMAGFVIAMILSRREITSRIIEHNQTAGQWIYTVTGKPLGK